MSKGRIYTFVAFCLSFAVVFGGWFLTKEMLDRDEAEILAEKGQISVEIEEVDVNENDPEVEIFKGEDLTEDVIAEVLAVWNGGGREVFHEPMDGQMDMEQAINAGRDWIDIMADSNIIPSYLSECSFDDTGAVLCTLDSNVSLEESFISYWKVTYVEGDVEIVLTIHALSGQVWNADISMNEDKMLYGTCSDEEILAIAFPFLTSDDAEMIVENSSIYKIFAGGTVYATLKRESILVTKEEPKARLLLSLGTYHDATK